MEISSAISALNVSLELEDDVDAEYTPYTQRPETYIVPVLFALIFVIGVLGNGTLVVVFLRHPNMRNVPNTYILSLALADLLVIVTCVPFTSTVYTLESWPWGAAVCKLSETAKDVSIGVSVFTLTALSAERYCAIVNPLRKLQVPLWILFIFVILILFAKHTYNIGTYWKRRGIPYKRPWPIFGNMVHLIFKTKTINNIYQDIYNEYPNAKYIGYHDFTKPMLLIRDPEIVKQITVKDFDHFVNRFKLSLESIDVVFGKSLPGLHDQKWKDMRASLTPIFSSYKMRAMFVLINESTQMTTDYLDNELKKENNRIEMNVQLFYVKHLNNAIASAIFGLNIDSLKNPNNTFYKMGSNISKAELAQRLKWIGFAVCPSLMKKLDISFINRNIRKYFESLLFETMESRKASGIARPDVIQLLLELKNNGIIENHQVNERDTGFATTVESNIGKKRFKNMNLTNDDLVAQSLIFFLAGFEGSANTLSFISYELALNPDVQEKLRQEVDKVLQINDTNLSYEVLNSMKYLDMVISESLRKSAPINGIQRVCGKKYKLPSAYQNGPDIELKVGDQIIITSFTLHHDPKYYPNPERFDPERFNDENKHNINSYTYMPFGIGPRNCIGSRFVMMVLKTTIVHLLSKFKFCVYDKTEIPLKIDRVGLSLSAVNGVWLAIEPR